jgi:hypothetical protein
MIIMMVRNKDMAKMPVHFSQGSFSCTRITSVNTSR